MSNHRQAAGGPSNSEQSLWTSGSLWLRCGRDRVRVAEVRSWAGDCLQYTYTHTHSSPGQTRRSSYWPCKQATWKISRKEFSSHAVPKTNNHHRNPYQDMRRDLTWYPPISAILMSPWLIPPYLSGYSSESLHLGYILYKFSTGLFDPDTLLRLPHTGFESEDGKQVL